MADFITRLLSRVVVQPVIDYLKDTGYNFKDKSDYPRHGDCQETCMEEEYIKISKEFYRPLFRNPVMPEVAKKLQQQLIELPSDPADVTCSSLITFNKNRTWDYGSPGQYHNLYVSWGIECSGLAFSDKVEHRLTSYYPIASFSVGDFRNADASFVRQVYKKVYKTFVPDYTGLGF